MNKEIQRLAYYNYKLRLKAGMHPKTEEEKKMWEREDWKLAEMQYQEKLFYKNKWGFDGK